MSCVWRKTGGKLRKWGGRGSTETWNPEAESSHQDWNQLHDELVNSQPAVGQLKDLEQEAKWTTRS